MNPKLFPTIMIVLSFLSAASYAYADYTDWRHIGYWIASSILIFSVTY
jgi:hypothetical protein